MFLVYISAFILTFGGGFSWFFVKSHASYSIPVEFSIFYRQFIAAIFCGIIAIAREKSFKITQKQLRLCLMVTLFYYIIYFVGAYNAAIYLVSGIVAFLSSLKVVFVEFIISYKHKTKPSKRIIIASILASIGISLMIRSNMNSSHVTLMTTLIGILYGLLCPIGNAISNVIIEVSDQKKKLDNFVIVAICSFISSLFFIILGVAKAKTFYLPPNDVEYLIGLTYVSCVSSGISMICLYYLIQKLGSTTATYMSLFHSPVAILLAILFQNYIIDTPATVGLIFCMISLYISNKYNLRKARYNEVSKKRKIRTRVKKV